MSTGLLKSISHDETKTLLQEVAKIDGADVEDSTKVQLLAILIADKTNIKLLKAFAQSARRKLSESVQAEKETVASKRRRLSEAKELLQ